MGRERLHKAAGLLRCQGVRNACIAAGGSALLTAR